MEVAAGGTGEDSPAGEEGDGTNGRPPPGSEGNRPHGGQDDQRSEEVDPSGATEEDTFPEFPSVRDALEEWEGPEHTAERARLLREGLAERTVFLAPEGRAPGLWGSIDKLGKV